MQNVIKRLIQSIPAAASDLSVSSNVVLAAAGLRESGFIGVLVSSGAHCSVTAKHAQQMHQ